MADLQPYRLAVLLQPQVSAEERARIDTLVQSWATERGGRATVARTEERRRLAYPVRSQRQATVVHVDLTIPRMQVQELAATLRQSPEVLRVRVVGGVRPTGKRLSEVPPKRPDAATTPSLKTLPPKEKVPIEKLEEKIDEILKEEVL